MSPTPERLSGLGRPLDPAWATNRAVLALTPLAGVAGAVWVWLGSDPRSPLAAAIAGAGAAFGGWALGREVDPDRQGGAFVAMGLAFAAALVIPETALLPLFAGLLLVRVVNRTTGATGTIADDAVVLGLVVWCSVSTGNPLVGFVAAGAFALDAGLPAPEMEAGPRRHWALAALSVLPALWALRVGPLGGSGLPAVPLPPDVAWSLPSATGWAAAVVIVLAFAVRIGATRTVESTCDRHGTPLSHRRVRGGMVVALALALTFVPLGDPGLAAAAPLWATLAGVSVWRGR